MRSDAKLQRREAAAAASTIQTVSTVNRALMRLREATYRNR
jgi:hypothetical protein